jgi:hypothetical protein
VMMRDLPLTVDILPQKRKPCLHCRAIAGLAHLKSVQTRVEVGLAKAKDMYAVVRDGAKRIHLHESHEIFLGTLEVPYVLGRDGGKERQVARIIQGGNRRRILSLQGIVPALEIFLPTSSREAEQFKMNSLTCA